VKRAKVLTSLLPLALRVLGLVAFSGAAGATALSDLAAQMRPGEWRELVTTNFGGMVLPNFAGDGSSPFIEFTDKAVRNPITKKIHIMGCARGAPGGGSAYECGSSAAPDAAYVIYDETTNTWSRDTTAPVSSGAHAYNHAAMNTANGDYYYLESEESTVHHLWKLSGGVWTSSLPYPQSTGSPAVAIEWFPERNALTLFDGGNGYPPKLHSLSSGSWSSVSLSNPNTNMGAQTFSRYSRARKLLYFGGGNNLGGGTNTGQVLLTQDQNGNIVRRADCPISMGIGGGGGRQVVDPVTGNLLSFQSGTPNTGHVYEYNPDTNQWMQAGTHPLGDANGQLIAVFVDVPESGVILAVSYSPSGSGKVYLYRHAAGTGAVVFAPLPPSEVAAH
jgi:hypothetical protein